MRCTITTPPHHRAALVCTVARGGIEPGRIVPCKRVLILSLPGGVPQVLYFKWAGDGMATPDGTQYIVLHEQVRPALHQLCEDFVQASVSLAASVGPHCLTCHRGDACACVYYAGHSVQDLKTGLCKLTGQTGFMNVLATMTGTALVGTNWLRLKDTHQQRTLTLAALHCFHSLHRLNYPKTTH